MGELRSDDGRYLAVQQGDQNFVVYDQVRGVAVWDRWSYEAQWGGAVAPPVPVTPPDPNGDIIIPKTSSSAARLIRVTDERDGELLNRGYSYWSQGWIGTDGRTYVFCGHADGHPRFFSVNLTTGNVARFGSLLDQFGYTGTGEGLYWDRDGWIYLPNGPVLRRVNPFTGEMRDVFSIEEMHPGCDLWQTHSSDDGRVHSGTVRQIVSDGRYPLLGTVVSINREQHYFDAIGDLDESQVTPDGKWLQIKEKQDGLLCNRFVDLETHEIFTLTNADGAVGHSDCGPSLVVGEWSPQHGEAPGQCVFWDLNLPLTPDRRRTLFLSDNVGHISVRNGVCLVSDDTMLSLAAMDGSGVRYLIRHGMMHNSSDPYDTQVFANMDATARVAAYMSNTAGRMDLYLAVL